MSSTFAVYIFILGLLFGSFLNVAVFRYNTGRSLGGRSFCPACNKKLHWYELVPVLSFLVQKARCRGCRGRISWQYPVIEILGGLLFILPAWKFYPNITLVAYYWLVFCFLSFIAFYDFRHKIIPNELVFAFIIIALGRPLFFGPGVWWADLILSLFGGLLIFLFFWALWFFSDGRWMGFGDAKLGFGMGILLGLSAAINAVVLAFWVGAVVGLVLVALSRLKNVSRWLQSYSIKSELPFAPFLVLGTILVVIFNISIFSF